MSDHLIVSTTDYQRLLQLVNSARLDSRIPNESLDQLSRELARAAVVHPKQVPQDVVTMYSTVTFRDLDTDEVESYTLVYPSEADVVNDLISVFAPIGTALLGYRVNDIVEWKVPSGSRRLKIERIVRREVQPEPERVAVLP